MNRPLMQHGVGQLEQLFASSKTDAKVLKQLENELRYRQVPRAVALLAEVQGALYSQPAKQAAPSAPAKPPEEPQASGLLKSPPVQPPLWTSPGASTAGAPGGQPELPLVSRGGPTVPPAVKSIIAPPPVVVAKAAPESGRKEPSPPPLVTLSDALKLFKASSTSSWESIEQVRRLAVQASSPTRLSNLPESQRPALLEEAKKFNAAYAVLSRARTSHQAGS